MKIYINLGPFHDKALYNSKIKSFLSIRKIAFRVKSCEILKYILSMYIINEFVTIKKSLLAELINKHK